MSTSGPPPSPLLGAEVGHELVEVWWTLTPNQAYCPHMVGPHICPLSPNPSREGSLSLGPISRKEPDCGPGTWLCLSWCRAGLPGHLEGC